MNQKQVGVLLACILILVFLFCVFYFSRPAKRIRFPRRRQRLACEAMYEINPAVACADTVCEGMSACAEKPRAVPTDADCDAACEVLDERITAGTLVGNICDYGHCKNMDEYYAQCHDCSVADWEQCATPMDYADAIQTECDGILPSNPMAPACKAACARLASMDKDALCFHAGGYCAELFKPICEACSYDEPENCTNGDLLKLVEGCDDPGAYTAVGNAFACIYKGEATKPHIEFKESLATGSLVVYTGPDFKVDGVAATGDRTSIFSAVDGTVTFTEGKSACPAPGPLHTISAIATRQWTLPYTLYGQVIFQQEWEEFTAMAFFRYVPADSHAEVPWFPLEVYTGTVNGNSVPFIVPVLSGFHYTDATGRLLEVYGVAMKTADLEALTLAQLGWQNAPPFPVTFNLTSVTGAGAARLKGMNTRDMSKRIKSHLDKLKKFE